MANFQANRLFRDFITIKGFKRMQVHSNKEYYTNSNGKQIKIDSESGMISLINKNGITEDFSNIMSSDQINEFINS